MDSRPALDETLKAGRDLLRRAFEVANKDGDPTFSAYSCHALSTNLLAVGEPASRGAAPGGAWSRVCRKDTVQSGY